MAIGWAGSSNTFTAGYRTPHNTHLYQNYPQYTFTFSNIAVNGWSIFPNLVNLADLSSADQILFDNSNNYPVDSPVIEAFVRKCQAAGHRVIGIINPGWTALTDDQIDTPVNETQMTEMIAILEAYNVPYVNGWTLIQAHVTGGGHISDWFGDTVHWNATGYAAVAAALQSYAPTAGTISLPASRVYADSVDFEHNPIQRAGTDHDGVTGVWVTDGTKISSSAADATITFTGTFRRWYFYNSDLDYPTIQVSIDGGAFENKVNGFDIGTRGEHTVIIKVVTTCKVDEFWAI